MSDEVEQLEKAIKNKDTSSMNTIILKNTTNQRVKLREKYKWGYKKCIISFI